MGSMFHGAALMLVRLILPNASDGPAAGSNGSSLRLRQLENANLIFAKSVIGRKILRVKNAVKKLDE
jgi:hypothetical protein